MVFPSSFRSLDQFDGAAADHEGRSIRRPRNDRWHDGCVRHAQAAQTTDAQLGVHDGVYPVPDLSGAHGMTETCRRSPREVDHVLPVGGFGSWDDLRFSDPVERGLAAKLAGRLDRPYN